MRKKHLIFYPVPAVKITAGKLPLDPDKIPIAGTTFPTPCTFECHHTNQRGIGGRGIKRTGISFGSSARIVFVCHFF